MMELKVKAEVWDKRDQEAESIAKRNKVMIITLDVGGKKFQTKFEILLSMNDTLFYKIFLTKKLDLRQ